MIKTILIDDEPLARSLVAEYLQAHQQFSIVQECNDGFEGVKAIQQHQPDLIFLDIQMPKINGFEMLELIEAPPSVIFTTAFDEYAIKAFEAKAIDYLLKPFSQERFDKAIEKWTAQNQQQKPSLLLNGDGDGFKYPDEQHRIVVKNGSKIVIIPTTEVYYVEAYDDYVKIFMKDGYHLKKKTMSYYESVLNPQLFLRVHRSFIVQLQMITRIEQYEKTSHIALLKNGAKVPLSKTGYVRLKEVLGI